MNDLNSSAHLPLSGKTIVVTRAKKQAKEFAELLEKLGARVIQFPAVEFRGPEDWSECDEILSSLNRYSGVIFTSVNAVEYFCRRAADRSVVNHLKDIRIFTVGEITRRAVEEYDMRAEKLLEKHTAEQLAHDIVRTIPSGSRLIFPKGNLGGAELISIVSAAGIRVDEVTIYKTMEPAFDDERKEIVNVIESTADLLTFFSPSSVTNVLHHLSAECLHRIPAAVIGETTADAARRSGIQVVLVAPQSAAEPFAKAIGQFYSH